MSQYFGFTTGTTFGAQQQAYQQQANTQAYVQPAAANQVAYTSAVSTTRPNTYTATTQNPNAMFPAAQNTTQHYATYNAMAATNVAQPATGGFDSSMYGGYYSTQQTQQQQPSSIHMKAVSQPSMGMTGGQRIQQSNLTVPSTVITGNTGSFKKQYNNSNQNFGGTGGGQRNFFKRNQQGGSFKPREQSLHYCEVCKISCAGPQTYKEHVEGQKHKKKEAAQNVSISHSNRPGPKQLHCGLCDVTCTGVDAYSAHLRGTKHEKTLKLHQKLGKPIPSMEPVVLNPSTTPKTAPGKEKTSEEAVAAPVAKKTISKITFVSGARAQNENKNLVSVTPGSANVESAEQIDLSVYQDKEIVPVGFEYIDTMNDDNGKLIQFHCKLCDCKFNDPNAKEMHLKGRRHRMQYKKKVDPSLEVDGPPSTKRHKIHEERLKKQQVKADFWRRRTMEDRMREMQMFEWANYAGQGMRMGGARKPESNDDKHVVAKHSSIYPTEKELQSVQRLVSVCERALKLVATSLSTKPTEPPAAAKEAKKESTPDDSPLRGVMRVGVLAKGLVLHGDLNVNLVLFTKDHPTLALVKQVASLLPAQIETVTKDTIDLSIDNGKLVMKSSDDPPASCTVTLTSPAVREAELAAAADGAAKQLPALNPDDLDKKLCLEALASFRHAKWFQAKASVVPSCVMVIRILRDLCQRVPTWTPLSNWAMELLVEKVVSSDGTHMSPGGALRRVFECLASGLLLPGGLGIADPCEKEHTDACQGLSGQEREDITASAQHALRLLAFGQIHKVLDMEPLSVPTPVSTKRKTSNSDTAEPKEKQAKVVSAGVKQETR